jgi:hypothetical protein
MELILKDFWVRQNILQCCMWSARCTSFGNTGLDSKILVNKSSCLKLIVFLFKLVILTYFQFTDRRVKQATSGRSHEAVRSLGQVSVHRSHDARHQSNSSLFNNSNHLRVIR